MVTNLQVSDILIIMCIKIKKAISGFENGKFIHSFRYVYPLFDKNNNYIGAYEVSTNSDNIQKNSKKI